jgi:hypothetical protein
MVKNVNGLLINQTQAVKINRVIQLHIQLIQIYIAKIIIQVVFHVQLLHF